MIKYVINNGVGRLQPPLSIYIKSRELDIECAGCDYLRVNNIDVYTVDKGRVTIKNVTPGIYHFDGLLSDGTVIPFEPLVVANGVKEFKCALLVHLQAEALDKRIIDYETRIRKLEAQMYQLKEITVLRNTVNDLIAKCNELATEIKNVQAGWDPTVSENA